MRNPLSLNKVATTCILLIVVIAATFSRSNAQCAVRFSPLVTTGTVVTATQTVATVNNLANAQGAANATFATLANINAVIRLDFGVLLPAGATITLRMARTAATNVTATISSSVLAGGPYGNNLAYTSTVATPAFNSVVYTVPAGGIQFLHVTRTAAANSLAVESATYSFSTCQPDYDDDNIVDVNDLDDDNDGLTDVVEGVTDTDADGLTAQFDLDSDGDGIQDIIEGGWFDSNGDGRVDGFTDGNNNGYHDPFQTSPLVNPDTDSDGTPDARDLNSDNDGVPDAIEGRDANKNGVADNAPTGTDTDLDGFDNRWDTDNGGTNTPRQDTDLDGLPDYIDTDDDGDGTATLAEDFNANLNWADDFTQGGTPRPDYLYRIPPPEICNNGLDDDLDGLTDCFDSDCVGAPTCALSFFGQSATCQYVPPTSFFDMREAWRTDTVRYDVYSTVTPIAGDIDNDGIAEVLAYAHNGLTGGFEGPGAKIYIINGVNGTIEDSIIMPVDAPQFNSSAISIADLDSDAFGEILSTGSDGRIYCYEHDGTPKWTSPIVPNFATPNPSIADFDGDGNPEVYASNTIFNGQTGALIAQGTPTSGGTGAPQFSGGLSPYGMSVAANVLGDNFCADCAGLELVAGDKVYSVDIGAGTMTQRVSSANNADGFTAVADYDGDGLLDGIISTDAAAATNCFVYVYNLRTGAVIATSPQYNSPTFWTIGQANCGDFDGDGRLEVGIVVENTYVVLEDYLTGLAQKWTHTVVDQSGFTASVLFDFQGDGQQEVIYQDEDSLYVFRGSDGASITSVLCRGGTVANHPIVLDVNDDDITEIVCGCSELPGVEPRTHGYIAAFGPATQAWVNSRAVWNQHSYFVTNIDDNLQVPLEQQSHHIIGDSVILNGFNIQSAELTINGVPTYAAPDGFPTINSIDKTNCGTGTNTLVVNFTVGNNSSASRFPRGAPIALYNGNPLVGPATLIDTVHMASSINQSQTQVFNVTIPDQGGNFDLWIIVNDTGQTTFPVVFPNAGIGECDYSNNDDSTHVNCSTLDNDVDGIPDITDIDDDNDGIPDLTETGGLNPNGDVNVNGIPDWRDPAAPGFVDGNSDGVDDRFDSDRDGIPNMFDIDADDDGLADAVEANGGTVPAGFDNATGRFTGAVGANGMPDGAETVAENGITILPLTNTDGTGGADYLDIDADNDGIVDNREVQTTAGYVAPSGVDANNNGRDDALHRRRRCPLDGHQHRRHHGSRLPRY
jgi:hypothetical protein